jgi:hypothetical protein
MTTYPFQLRQELAARLPPPAPDGRCYIDVKVGGAWDGILVVDPQGVCSGIYVRRRIEEWPLPFDASQIEDVRPACPWNRVLAQIPFDLFTGSLVTVIIVSPALLVLSVLLFPPLAVVSVVACTLAIYFMYQASGFPFIRLPVAILGVGQVIVGVMLLARWTSAWFRGGV